VSVQNEYNYDDRSSDDVPPNACASESPSSPGIRSARGRSLRSVKLKRIAAARGASAAQVALAWLLRARR